MTSLFAALLGDPVAITEAIAAALTATYLRHIVVSERAVTDRAESTRLSAFGWSAFSFPVLRSSAWRSSTCRSSALHDRQYAEFQLREPREPRSMSLPKRSLRVQNGAWWR